jgi:hypothetical protein
MLPTIEVSLFIGTENANSSAATHGRAEISNIPMMARGLGKSFSR